MELIGIIGWLIAVATGSGLVFLAHRVRRNERTIREIRQTQTEVQLTAEILARAAEQAPTWKRHLRGLVLVPVVAAVRQVARPQVALAMAGLAFAGATAFEANRDAGTIEQSGQERRHTLVTTPRGHAPRPVANLEPITPAAPPPVRLQTTPAPAASTPLPSTTTSTVPTVTATSVPLLSTTTSVVPEIVAEPSTADCVVELGGLGIPAGLLCRPESP